METKEIKTKEDLVKVLGEKGITKDQIKKVWEEKKTIFKERGFKDKDVPEALMIRAVGLFFRKQLTSGEVEVEIIPLAFSSVSDYGAKKKYDEAKKAFLQDPEKAVEEGITDGDGNPLWKGHSFKKGKIDPDRELKRNVIALAKRQEDKEFLPTIMTLSGNILDTPTPIRGRAYIIKAVLGAKNEDKNKLVLYSSQATTFSDGKKVDRTKLIDMIKKGMKNYWVEFTDIKSVSKRDKVPEFVVFMADVISTYETQSGLSNKISLQMPATESLVLDDEIIGWIPEDIPLTVADGAMDVITIGRAQTRMKEDEHHRPVEQFTLEVYGFFATNEADIKSVETVPPIKPDGKAQKTLTEEEAVDFGEESEKKVEGEFKDVEQNAEAIVEKTEEAKPEKMDDW